MPQSPSTSSRQSRPSPFPYVGSSLRPNNHPALRSKSTSPTGVDSTLPDSANSYRQTFQHEDYQNFGFPMPSASVPTMNFDPQTGHVFPQLMPAHASTYPTPEFLGQPFSYTEPSTTLTSPIISGPSSFTSNSPDRAFQDRYDDSPERDVDEDDFAPPDTRETTPPVAASEKTRRPPNAWILYRSDRIREYNKIGSLASFAASRPTGSTEDTVKAKKGKKGEKSPVKPSKGPPQAEISRIIAEQWKKEPKDVKAKYDRLAEIKKMEHQRDFPNYKYQPMKKEDKIKLKEKKDREKALARKEKALDKAMRPRKPRVRPPRQSARTIQTLAKEEQCDLQEGSSTQRHLVTPRSPKKSARKPRKTPASASRAGKARDDGGESNKEFMDGHQVFWGIIPELPNSYVAPPPSGGPIGPESRLHDMPDASGLSTAQLSEFGSAPTPQGFWQSQSFPSVPPAEAGLAIDSQSIVPYIFEPAPFPDISAGPTYQSLNSSRSDYFPGQYGQPGPSSLQQEPLPPVEIPGVTENELAEMWGLLEEDNVENTDGRQTVNWASDPTDLVNQWADLSVPIEDSTTYISPRNFSGSVASQIASEWHNHPYHSLQPEMHHQHSDAAYQQPGGYYQQPNQYPSSRPGYITIEVPVSSLQQQQQQQPHMNRPPTYSSVHQGPPLAQATPLSPVNGGFPNSGNWSGRSFDYSTPFSAAGLPLDNRNDNYQPSIRTPNYMQSIDGTFESMQSRRVSEAGGLDDGGWISPTERLPSFGDFRLPSSTFVSFPEQEFDFFPENFVEPIHQKVPMKKGRVVAGQHAPPPQRVAS